MPKTFFVDYQITGTLVLDGPNVGAIKLRVRKLIREATGDLKAISGGYFEAGISEPIDCHRRYPRAERK